MIIRNMLIQYIILFNLKYKSFLNYYKIILIAKYLIQHYFPLYQIFLIIFSPKVFLHASILLYQVTKRQKNSLFHILLQFSEKMLHIRDNFILKTSQLLFFLLISNTNENLKKHLKRKPTLLVKDILNKSLHLNIEITLFVHLINLCI